MQWVQLCEAIYMYMRSHNLKQSNNDRKLSDGTCYVKIFMSILQQQQYQPL